MASRSRSVARADHHNTCIGINNLKNRTGLGMKIAKSKKKRNVFMPQARAILGTCTVAHSAAVWSIRGLGFRSTMYATCCVVVKTPMSTSHATVVAAAKCVAFGAGLRTTAASRWTT